MVFYFSVVVFGNFVSAQEVAISVSENGNVGIGTEPVTALR